VQCNPCQSSSTRTASTRRESLSVAIHAVPDHLVHAKTSSPSEHVFRFHTYPTPTMQQQSTTVAHNALPPPSSTTVARSSRISVHSHIKGLGLTQDGYAASDAAGFIGQTNAREVPFVPYHPVQDENQSLGSSPRPAASSWTLSSRVNSLVVPFSS
jgi:hypothetical protein